METNKTELPKRPVLKVAVEIDEYVSAEHEMHFAEHAVRRQIVAGKDYALLERAVHGRRIVPGVVIFRKRSLAARLLVVFGGFLELCRFVDPLAGTLQDLVVEVGGVNGGPSVDAFLLEHDGQ
ncbi:MAG: hypothetical protein A2491_16085 [Bacteroidetes bacterium RIFOXYC12_FULL_35_7]|nr:MAG: hypothetical protein A2491_16085 [Bacteroidetes bacterium RIFOXYC12_FULL_35_7]